MPIYCFRYPECDETRSVLMSIYKMEISYQVCRTCDPTLMDRDYPAEGCHIEIKGMCKKADGYSRSMPEMVDYFQRHKPKEMSTKQKTVHDLDVNTFHSVPKG